MKNVHPLRAARRRIGQLTKLGPNPVCFDCGESDIACLELDHPVGKGRDSEFVRVRCRNCHRKREWERDHAGLTTNGQHKKETPQEALYRYLMLLAGEHRAIAASIERKAEEFLHMEK